METPVVGSAAAAVRILTHLLFATSLIASACTASSSAGLQGAGAPGGKPAVKIL